MSAFMLHLLLTATASTGGCGCFCVDGQSLSLCTEIERAALGEQHCTAAAQCAGPGLLAAPPEQPGTPPVTPTGARNCRFAAVSSPGGLQQHQIAICDVVSQ
ncbi:MAG: hypothetical protein AAGI15_13755 [Pseudomonadota bacterium]